jgi:hypothetical protein
MHLTAEIWQTPVLQKTFSNKTLSGLQGEQQRKPPGKKLSAYTYLTKGKNKENRQAKNCLHTLFLRRILQQLCHVRVCQPYLRRLSTIFLLVI